MRRQPLPERGIQARLPTLAAGLEGGQHIKEDLQALADRLGLELRVAHYPPFCSKYNPIEHRLFPHITWACQGVAFHSVDIAKQFMEKRTRPRD